MRRASDDGVILNKKPTVAILGCGYVGLLRRHCLANCGYKTYAVEPLQDRLDVIKSGKSFFYEDGIDQLIQKGLDEGTFIPTGSYDEAVADSDIVFCCMGTPDNADGSSNLTYVFGAVDACVQHMKNNAIFVQKSTVPVGTSDRIIEKFETSNKQIRYVSNPEFLREGTAIFDTLWADHVVVGSDDTTAANEALELYRAIEHNRAKLSEVATIAKPSDDPQTEYIATSRSSAELIKVSANAFLALKISFANSIAKLADKTGADVEEVMKAVGADRRIGPDFFNAGIGYGGGCFPKDVSGLIRSAEDYGVELGIMEAVSQLNASMPHYVVHKFENQLQDGESLSGKKVAVLGLAFKPGTSDTRRSPAIAIANSLAERGASVRAYDPKAIEEAKPELDPAVTVVDSVQEALAGASWVFVATAWPEFTNMTFANLEQLQGVVDCMNCLNPEAIKTQGLQYIGVGKA